MTDAEAEAARLNLIDALAATIQLLRKCDASQWADQLDDSKRLIEQRDFRGIEQVFYSYGGMGSFNDLLIHPANGHTISDAEIATTNDQLRELQSQVYELVGRLRQYEAS